MVENLVLLQTLSLFCYQNTGCYSDLAASSSNLINSEETIKREPLVEYLILTITGDRN